MAATYKQFLASPSSSLLADNASLHYVTTTTSITGPAEIIKHLTTTSKQVRKKKEDILNTVDSQTAAALEIDTGLEFLTSGGPYLPGLDDNFVADRVVFLPLTHFVSFANDGKISQIRLSWDQGSLLKQLDVIGKTGRNWPIKDSREQISLIQKCVKATGAVTSSTQDQKEVLIRTRGNSSNALRDPHATLHMQPTREEIENIERESAVNPYAGNKKPSQRSFTDILGDNPDGGQYDDRDAMSPHKAGGSKSFQPMRIFDGQDEYVEEDTPKGRPGSQYIKPDPRKYTHFDFADGSDPADAPKAGVDFDKKPKGKHDSQWSFDDFVTPSKPQATKAARAQEVRHWDTDKDALGEQTPAPGPGKGRRDAETHFELQDDGEQVARPERHRQKGSMHNDGLGLYKNKLFNQEEADADLEDDRALGNITNLKGRGQTFNAHWEMNDESPAPNQSQRQPVPEARKKAVKMMDANWSSYDESPKQQKENTRLSDVKNDQGIHIAGDGMGGKKGTNRDWLYGGGEFEEEAPKPKPTGRRDPNAHSKGFWEF